MLVMAKSKQSLKNELPSPAALLAAAKKAPAVFSITTYFRAIYVMRQKGYSWRQLEKWVRDFGIKISAVHLRRLFVSESARLAELSARELADQGWSQDEIRNMVKQSDPAESLTAPDPEDAALIAQRRELLEEAGVPREEINKADLSFPVKVGDKTV